MSTVLFYAQFTSSGLGADDLTVTVDVTRVTRSDGTQAAAVTGGSATQVTAPNKRGLYLYRLTGADLSLYDYVAVFITAGTADLKEIPALARSVEAAELATPAEAVGRPDTLNGMLRRAFEWVANKRSRDRSTGTVLLKGADDTTTIETQTQSTTGSTDAQSKGA